MGEKRFIFATNEKRFNLDDESRIWDNGTPMTALDIVMMLNEQQSTIQSLKEENEQLKRQNKALKDSSLTDAYFDYLENSRTVTLKVVEESEPFKFNKNCAKPYEIRSVSPNGVVRVGEKNSKVSWRMKDVREISAELPPFEDFNRETFMQMRNKFCKFDKDVLGRIIYNIYIGIFGEYI